MIFNREQNGAEELRVATSSYYANADFDKIAGIINQVQTELAKQVGTDVMNAIDTAYNDGEDSALIAAAQRTVGYMATLRYFRLNDISHETDGRKVKMDGENERRPFEWQLERDDQMHLEEYYNSFDTFVNLLMDDATFQAGELYQRLSSLLIPHAGVLEWVTGIEATPHLYLRLVPLLHEAQLYVQKSYGESPLSEIQDESLKFLAQCAIGHRAVALFVKRTEMKALPAGAFRTAITSGGKTESSTTAQLHDFYWEEIKCSEDYVHDMQTRRDALADESVSHLVMPENNEKNKYFRV